MISAAAVTLEERVMALDALTRFRLTAALLRQNAFMAKEIKKIEQR